MNKLKKTWSLVLLFSFFGFLFTPVLTSCGNQGNTEVEENATEEAEENNPEYKDHPEGEHPEGEENDHPEGEHPAEN